MRPISEDDFRKLKTISPSQDFGPGWLAESGDEKMDEIPNECASDPTATIPVPKRVPTFSEVCRKPFIEMPIARGRGNVQSGSRGRGRSFQELEKSHSDLKAQLRGLSEWKLQFTKQLARVDLQVQKNLGDLDDVGQLAYQNAQNMKKWSKTQDDQEFAEAQFHQDLQNNFETFQKDQTARNCLFNDEFKSHEERICDLEQTQREAVIIFSINIFKIFKCSRKHIKILD